MRQLEARLRRLECSAGKRSGRLILVDDGSGRAQAEAAALRKEHGDDIEVFVVNTGVPRSKETWDHYYDIELPRRRSHPCPLSPRFQYEWKRF